MPRSRTAEVDQNSGETQTQQAGKKKTAAPARVTETAVGLPPISVADKTTMVLAAPVDGNAVARPVLARRVVLVGGTTDLTPSSAETTSEASCVHPVPVTINRKWLEASNPLRAKVGPSKRYSDDRPLTRWKPPGAVAHKKARRRQPSRREEQRSNVSL